MSDRIVDAATGEIVSEPSPFSLERMPRTVAELQAALDGAWKSGFQTAMAQLGDQNQPGETDYFEFTPTGAVPHGNPSAEFTARTIDQLGTLEENVRLWLGDVLVYAHGTFPQQFPQMLGRFKQSTISNAMWVSRSVPPEVRLPGGAPFDWYQSVAPLARDAQSQILERAQDEGMAAWEVRAVVREYQRQIPGEVSAGEAVRIALAAVMAKIDSAIKSLEDAARRLEAGPLDSEGGAEDVSVLVHALDVCKHNVYARFQTKGVEG